MLPPSPSPLSPLPPSRPSPLPQPPPRTVLLAARHGRLTTPLPTTLLALALPPLPLYGEGREEGELRATSDRGRDTPPLPIRGGWGGGQATRRPRGTRGVVTSGNPPGPRAQTTRGLTLREPDGASERAVVSSEVQAEPMGCAPPTRASARTAPSPTRGRHPNEVEGGRRRSDAAGSRLDRRPARGRRTRARDTWQWKDGGRRGRAAAFERGVRLTEVFHRCPMTRKGASAWPPVTSPAFVLCLSRERRPTQTHSGCTSCVTLVGGAASVGV